MFCIGIDMKGCDCVGMNIDCFCSGGCLKSASAVSVAPKLHPGFGFELQDVLVFVFTPAAGLISKLNRSNSSTGTGEGKVDSSAANAFGNCAGIGIGIDG